MCRETHFRLFQFTVVSRVVSHFLARRYLVAERICERPITAHAGICSALCERRMEINYDAYETIDVLLLFLSTRSGYEFVKLIVICTAEGGGG